MGQPRLRKYCQPQYGQGESTAARDWDEESTTDEGHVVNTVFRIASGYYDIFVHPVWITSILDFSSLFHDAIQFHSTESPAVPDLFR